MKQESTACQVSDERGTAHPRATQADNPGGNEARLFLNARQFHGVLHIQLLLWWGAPGCHFPAGFPSICVGMGAAGRSWHGAGRILFSCITHSWDGNLEPFYKEKVTVFPFRARWKSELPLKPAESKWNKRKEPWKGQTCTGDFLLLGQAEGTGRTALPHGLYLLQPCGMDI